MNTMQTETEAQLEERLIQDLESEGWQRATLIYDEASLEANFRNQFNRLNDKVLGGVSLSDAEFHRLLLAIKDKSVFQSAKQLRDMLLLERDDNTQVYVRFFDKQNAGNNVYQVANQITFFGRAAKNARENRYDVTLLINGLPVEQIELKKRGGSIKEAFAQVNRYRRETFVGLFRFVQLFVISNGVDTRYYANNDGLENLPFAQTFTWADRENVTVNRLTDYAHSFLRPQFTHEMLTTWMVLQETDFTVKVMRPYQIWASKAILDQALDTGGNGYIWHSTGSGKTLTSFKTAQLLKDHPKQKFSKVVFLVDRADLNQQTFEEFNKFGADSVLETRNTGVLKRQLLSEKYDDKMIVTTIQKLNVLLSKNDPALDKLRDQPIVFMMDECHRSQFGEMHERIKKFFPKAQYFGFTGTPIFEVNAANKRTTTDVFGRCLHKYLMTNAIRDENVLPFNVEYVETYRKNTDYEDKPVSGVDTSEVLHNQRRLRGIVEDVIEEFPRKTLQGRYKAMFATDRIRTAGEYYGLLRELAPDLKVAMIFTWDANQVLEDGETAPREVIEAAISDYNSVHGTTFSTDTYKEYFVDLSKRMKSGKIDILLVANMFLTGSDFKLVNTLFYDKHSEHHSLVQHFSRTNRTDTEAKRFGNIRVYRPIKEQVDAAFKLFSDADNTDGILVRPYSEVLIDLIASITNLKKLAPTPDSVDTYQTEDEDAKFVYAMRDVNRLVTEAKPHVEFEMNTTVTGMNAQDLADYQSKYLTIHEKVTRGGLPKESILHEIDFELTLLHRDIINAAYLYDLIRALPRDNKRDLDNATRDLIKRIEREGDDSLRLKSSYLREFFVTILPNLDETTDPIAALNDFADQKRAEDIQTYVTENEDVAKVDADIVNDWANNYAYYDDINTGALTQVYKLGFRGRAAWLEKTKNFLQTIALKYS